MMKKEALSLAVWTYLHWLNHLDCTSANANLTIRKLRRNFKWVLALAFAESAGNLLEIADGYFFSFCCHNIMKKLIIYF